MPLIEFNPDYYPNPNGGRPISAGKMYVGEPGTDPTIVSNQKQVLALETNGDPGSIPEYVPIAQPIRTNAGGVPINASNKPVLLYVSGDYSISIRSNDNVQFYYIPTNLSGESSTEYLSNYNCNLETAVSLIGSIEKTHLIIDCIPAELTEDLTVTENITLEWREGFVLSSDESGPYTLILESEIIAGHYILFDENVNLNFTTTFRNEVKAYWAGDLTVDIGEVINKTLNAGAKNILLPSGEFPQLTEIIFDEKTGVSLTGQGKLSTVLKVEANIVGVTVKDTCIYCLIEKFKILVNYATTNKKGIEIFLENKASEIEIENSKGIGINCRGNKGTLHNVSVLNSGSFGISFDYASNYWNLTGKTYIKGNNTQTGLNTYEGVKDIIVEYIIIENCPTGGLIRGDSGLFNIFAINNSTRAITVIGNNNRINILSVISTPEYFIDTGDENKIKVIPTNNRYPEDYVLIFGQAMPKNVNGGSGGIVASGAYEIIRPITFVDPLNDDIPGSDVVLAGGGADENTFLLPAGKYKIDMIQVLSNFKSALVWIETTEIIPVVIVNSLSSTSDIQSDTSLNTNIRIDINDFYLETDGTKRYRIKAGVRITAPLTGTVNYDAILGKARELDNVISKDEFYMVTVIKKLK